MADNRDAPIGFIPVRMLTGGLVPVHQYPLLSTHIRIGVGDVVELTSAGTVDVDDDANTTPEYILGIAVALYDSNKNPISSGNSSISTKYIVASTGGYVDVALALPHSVFSVQADGSVLETARFAAANTTTTACDTTTGRSKMELSASTTTAANWIILDKVDDPSNAWGTNVNLLVTPGEGFWQFPHAGV